LLEPLLDTTAAPSERNEMDPPPVRLGVVYLDRADNSTFHPI